MPMNSEQVGRWLAVIILASVLGSAGVLAVVALWRIIFALI